jgi:hypothetical protein
MKYYLIALLLILTATFANAQSDQYYANPLPLAEHELLLEQMPANYGDLIYHVRLKPSKSKLQWGVVWNYASTENYSGLEVSANLNDVSVDTELQPIYVTIYRVIDGVRSVVESRTINERGDIRHGLSVRLRMNDIGSVAEIGATMAGEVLPISLDSNSGYALGVYCETPMSLVRKSLLFSAKDEPQYAPFADFAELKAYLSTSADAFEGFWNYLDRDTDANKVSLGGDYRFATVKIDGRYALVYLDGARTNAEAWRPMRIKAWLIPTIFIGNYDLIWFNPFGERIDLETSASVTDNAIMAFNFPLYKSSVRWRRVTAGDLF